VRARNQEGQGNTVQVNETTGSFSINVLPGNTGLHVILENSLWAPPVEVSGAEWFVNDNQPLDTGIHQLLARQATITGSVTDDLGHTVADMVVRAWRIDGAGVGETKTDAGGNYTLHLIQGIWEVRAIPAADSPYVAIDPPIRVRLIDETSSGVALLNVVTADITVNGQIVDASNNPLAGLKGRVYPTYKNGDRWPSFGQGAPIVNGQFTLKLSSKTTAHYKLRAIFPPAAGYTAIAAVDIFTSNGSVQTVNLPVAPNNSSISGLFLNHATDQPKLGIPGMVYAASNSGALAKDKLNPLTGGYYMPVATTDTAGRGGTTWLLRGYVDPTTGFHLIPPRRQAVFIPFNNGAGADVTANFTVAELDARIAGRVTDPFGTPIPGARVSVMEQNAPAGIAFHRWALTNQDGHYAIRIPAGTYTVRADFRNWVNPVPRLITVHANTTALVNLQFRQRDAEINGQALYLGVPHAAFIRAYSDTGAHVFTTSADGNYTLFVNSGDTWHVQAVGEDGSDFLRSPRIAVIPIPGVNPGNNLDMVVVDKLPKAEAFSFDATQDQVFILSNDCQVLIPAGAMATSGLVTLVIRPLPALADTGGTQPISFGYRLNAYDQAKMPIERFNSTITMRVPFSVDQLITLGITPEHLLPTYWDEATFSWKPIPNFSLEVYDDGNGYLNLSINHFTDFAMLNSLPTVNIYIPSILH
jgi:protocatechuate 3,4-dioxygenase beta subunit